jgi:hypothetical protein
VADEATTDQHTADECSNTSIVTTEVVEADPAWTESWSRRVKESIVPGEDTRTALE